ncbi:MAG: ribonuclease E activity regulator RraA [Minicystis sp.]
MVWLRMDGSYPPPPAPSTTTSVGHRRDATLLVLATLLLHWGMLIATTDLCDEHGESVRVVASLFRDFGKIRHFAGVIATIKVHEDNVLVRAALEQPGDGRVLVVDGGGSLRCALMGDMIAELAVKSGWSGVLLHGCIRDAEAIGRLDLGVRALGTHPRKSGKKGWGEKDVPVSFGGVTFAPGEWLCADADGIVVAARPLG